VVTSPAVALNGDWAIVSGEIKPGQRTTDVWAWHI
jgi:N-acetylneuraminic acid mutarotase